MLIPLVEFSRCCRISAGNDFVLLLPTFGSHILWVLLISPSHPLSIVNEIRPRLCDNFESEDRCLVPAFGLTVLVSRVTDQQTEDVMHKFNELTRRKFFDIAAGGAAVGLASTVTGAWSKTPDSAASVKGENYPDVNQ